MKDYLRKQYANTVSINLVKEVASFATELERTFKKKNFKDDPIDLAVQLFRTLTEFASGCPKNRV